MSAGAVRRAAGALALWAAAGLGCSTAPLPPHAQPAAPINPEAAGSRQAATPGRVLQRQAVAAAHPLAAEAGAAMLRAGGSALDAAIAAQMVLAIVEPQSSGLGGSAFLLHWDGQRVQAFDGRETAPAAADERLFLQPDGTPLGFHAAAVGGRAVGVPGVMRMLELAHRQHGRLPWARLFEPAIALAEQGFEVGPRLHSLLTGEPHLRQQAAAAAYFYQPDGTPHPVGTRLRNPALAAVLRRLATEGSAALHQGPVADSITAAVRGHATNPGRLTAADLAGYQAQEREPLCTDWRAWRICGMPPPSSGHLAVMQTLAVLDRLQPAVAPPLQDGTPSAETLHRYAEAARLAFADRARYVADPAFVAAPAGRWSALLDADYLDTRAALVGPQAMKTAPAGTPRGAVVTHGSAAEQPEYGTSHLSVVDAQGRAVAMTTTIEDQFGARLLVDGGTGLTGGFLLNNQLTDFAFAPTDATGRPVANRVQPGKRPRSSMSPTLVFDRASGRLQMSLGSPGGAMIIHYTARTLLGTLAGGLDAQTAIDQPNFGTLGGPVLLEEGRFSAATVQALQARGHDVRTVPLTSGLQAIERHPQGWFGGADPRREGVVAGD